ncbi:hypothetical protein M3Y94_01043000 [Aphelenchoides besseyi]|nr:hypothetical protein M3Y94_01043000 [Aphelenchoides besseyi]KAI6224018.1 Calponin-homology (CH) domain-containing protein [Aphelenchoides besseyi]
MDFTEISELDSTIRELPPVDLDEERRRRAVRHYAYRLHEVRNWMVECLPNEKIPAAFDLDQELHDGVLLAKLVIRFDPNRAPSTKIFKSDGRHQYRQTDNINLWRQFCLSYDLMTTILPDSHDVYVGRNTRTIFALSALAHRLFQLRKAPPIREQTGNVNLTNDDYERLQQQIKNSGCSFASVADHPTVKQPAVESVETFLSQIRESIANGNVDEFKRLLSTDHHVLHVDDLLLNDYWTAVGTNDDLTLDQLQETIVIVNRQVAIQRLCSALTEEPKDLNEVSHQIAAMNVDEGRVLEACLGIYAHELSSQHKANGHLKPKDVEHTVSMINAAASVREATLSQNPTRIYDSLTAPALELNQLLHPTAANNYAAKLIKVYRSEGTPLVYGQHLRDLIVEVNEKHALKRMIQTKVKQIQPSDAADAGKTLNVAVLLRKSLVNNGPYRSLKLIGLLRYVLYSQRQIIRDELESDYRDALLEHYKQIGAPLLHGSSLKRLIVAVNAKVEDKKKSDEQWKQIKELIVLASKAADDRDSNVCKKTLSQAYEILEDL